MQILMSFAKSYLKKRKANNNDTNNKNENNDVKPKQVRCSCCY